MPSDRSDAIVVTTRRNGHARRAIFEPRSDGRFDHVEETLTQAGEWRQVGSAVVDAVEVENGG